MTNAWSRWLWVLDQLDLAESLNKPKRSTP
jgi:hypothetical protein